MTATTIAPARSGLVASTSAVVTLMALAAFVVVISLNSGVITSNDGAINVVHGVPMKQAQRQLPETDDDDIMIGILKERLQPHELQLVDGTSLPPHQFMHLHHMKTGGTSVDDLLKCSVKRMQQVQHYQAKHMSLHECNGSHFKKCLEHTNELCQKSLDDTALLSYCAPLKYLTDFKWTSEEKANRPDFAAITVLRHPAERVWSNFRFATKGCYKCNELKNVYKAYEDNTLEAIGMRNESLCVRQMLNHQTFNLLSSKRFDKYKEGLVEVPEEDQEEMVKEAIDNMKNFFTMIGITEELGTFGQMIPKVFPFMATTLEGSHRACHLPHSNKSPTNNKCIDNKEHWDLPSHPDKETQNIIEKHNQMDIKLYEAAVKQFQLQKKALGMDENDTA
eukprot:CAMPEP_0119558550 /NCGR_PEP_ID=MMETSP1352-20130426/10858_1 /TAXON_ID=265584 /ORGANISM="Stauroneis constricta, Strain CCMP1120" /LENGTH=391 /DNA_ID=CAMNT_0007605937 /DNA_START=36 /DNA_END=1211 /DNA_ORIENTATION=-